MIFNQEDTGYGAGQPPVGHIKIEVKEGKGKLTALVQNLVEDSRYEYRLYLLKLQGDQVVPLRIGNIRLLRNRGEVVWLFDPMDVGGLGSSIDEFNTAVVLAEAKGEKNSSVLCPLAAYRNGQTPWREKLADVLYGKRAHDKEIEEIRKAAREQGEVVSKYTGGLESRYRHENLLTKEPEQIKDKEDSQTHIAAKAAEELLASQHGSLKTETGNPRDVGEEPKDDTADSSPLCTLRQTGKCSLSSSGTGDHPCTACYLHGGSVSNGSTAKSGDVSRLRLSLDKYFERCDPFMSGRMDYEWWKISSPVHMNNVLYECNVKTPLLFNPMVMMSHFKYRHLIFGIYTDAVRQRNLLICGIPAIYSANDRPFGDMCRWVPVNVQHTGQDNFGYWLVYMEPGTGRLLSLR